MKRQSMLPYLVLLFGVLIASIAAILIRLAQQEGMPSLAIAAWRLGFAVLILTPIAWSKAGDDLRKLQRRDILLGIGSGGFLALHFATWISSLEYTSVANSMVLVTTNPVWVGIASWLFLHERPGWGTASGIVLTITGSVLIILSGLDDTTVSQFDQPTLGNILALLGAFGVSGYFLIGRSMRRRLSILAYIWVVYTSSAVFVWLLLLLSGQPVLGFSLLAYLIVLGLAVGPQLLGHTSFNWALAHLSATFVTIAILAEPIISASWAWLLFGERIDPTTRGGLIQVTGFVLILVGIYIAARSERPEQARAAETAEQAPA